MEGIRNIQSLPRRPRRCSRPHFIQQCRVESGAVPPGSGTVTMTPPSPDSFYTARTSIEARATAAEGFSFGGWFGPSLATIHGISGNPARFPVIFEGLNYTGVFIQAPLTTITASPPGRRIVVDSKFTIRVPVNIPWDVGSTHMISVEDAVQDGPSGASRWLFQNWSDGGAVSHSVEVPEEPSTITANFDTQYLFTSTAVPAERGSVDAAPTSADGYYDAGTTIQVEAMPNAGSELTSWFGDLTGQDNPQALLMSDQRDVTALFSASRRLMSGVPGEFSFPRVDSPTMANGPFGFTVDVPPGATELDIRLQTAMTSTDLDLYVNHGSDIVLSDGRVVADYSSTGPGGVESIVITPDSSPPLVAGTYFIGFVIWTTGVPSSGTITATFEAPDVPVTEISISVPAFTFTAQQGMNPPPQFFDVRNSGDGTLNYQITTDQPWLSASPNQGSSTGEAETIQVSINSESLEEGTVHGTITVSESQAQATKQAARIAQTTSAIIPVTLVVTSPGIPGPQISSGGIILATGTPVVGQVSPLSIFTIFGQEFAPEGTLVLQPELDAGGGVAANLGGTCVEIDGERSPLFAVLPTQINGQALPFTAAGSGSRGGNPQVRHE